MLCSLDCHCCAFLLKDTVKIRVFDITICTVISSYDWHYVPFLFSFRYQEHKFINHWHVHIPPVIPIYQCLKYKHSGVQGLFQGFSRVGIPKFWVWRHSYFHSKFLGKIRFKLPKNGCFLVKISIFWSKISKVVGHWGHKKSKWGEARF